MNFSARTLFNATLLCLFAPLSLAQSGTPAPFVPMANPDPRLAQILAKSSRLEAPGQVAISPDGTLIAYTLRGREGSTLHLLPYPSADQSKEKIVSVAAATDCSNSSPVWSPDSQTLAFTSTCTSKQETPGQPQIFLYSRATGEAKQLTHLTGIFQQAAFSPDGKSLAFLFVENATRSAGALAPMKPWSGVIGEDGVEIQRVYSVDIGTALGNFITPANLHVYEFDWAPNSHEIAFVGANPPGENNWWIAKLYTMAFSRHIEQENGNTKDLVNEQIHTVFDPNTTSTALHGLQIAVPRFSPDGKHIAFIGGLMSDQGSTGGDIWVVPANGGDPTDITPNIDGTPTWIAWEDDPNFVGYIEDRRGHTLISSNSIIDKKPYKGLPVDLGEVSVSGGPIKDAISLASKTKTGDMAFVMSGHALAPEIYAGTGAAQLHQITHFNDGAKPPARTESLEWTNEGFHIQGWLTYPANYDPAKKYPLIVQVHGGPSASAGARWGGSVWNDLGYFTFAPNPRGSFGEGEKFTAANKKDFGYGDLRDILAGMDAVEAKVSIDKNREGLTGGSYGGFMTMFGVTQTHRFHAAIAVAGISNWQSYYGENSIDQWMIPFFGASVYDDPADYAKSSAIDFIKDVTTPTLVVVGDRDGECPPPQSFEFWHALRADNVPTQLVIYPNEGHGIRQPDHARDLEAREVAWFAKYMPAQ
jgi:dipeptidyl aminopeptidase/acylaminoacyl peptidase